MQERKVRKPSFAGTFYPSDPAKLQSDVEQYISNAEIKACSKDLVAVIAPHAGYVYSGQVAGFSYKAVSECFKDSHKSLNVFLIGPSHQVFVKGLAVSNVNIWETPLGNIEVSDITDKMIKETRLCNCNNEAHRLEHCLEVQLPFLQVALSGMDFKIIPILISEMDFAEAAGTLNEYLDEDSLLVVSSDLSHYFGYKEALALDNRTIQPIVNSDISEFETYGEACGKLPIKIAMELASTNMWNPMLLKYKNSGDTAGDKESVVGYASISFYKD